MSQTMSNAPFLVVFTVLLVLNGCDSARILCVSHQFKSHMLMVHSVAEGLIGRGHEVYTIFSDRMPVPMGLEEKGFKILKYHTPEGSNIMHSDANSADMLEHILSDVDDHFGFFSNISAQECLDMDNDNKLYKQLFDIQFDLAIVDVYALSSCMVFIPLKLDILFILVPSNHEIEMTRTPILPSFVPSLISLHTDEMTFSERLKNTFYTLYMACPSVNQFPSMLDVRLLEKYNKDPNIKSWNDLARNAQLFFHSRGHVIEFPAPLNPNVISVECLTCKPAKPLSEDIEAMISHSEGLIIVSFGSLVDDLPDYIAAKFLEAFSQMNETILWRHKGKQPGDLPSNIKVVKWLPQNDLLGHPKTKLFITHSGNNGQYESVYHGVPMLAFPLYAEQPHNAVRIVKHGFGLSSDIHSFTSNELVRKMSELINNQYYKNNTQKAGKILKNRFMDAKQTAVYWIEHVLEFGGNHLRSYALEMPWYSFYMIDIIIFLQTTIIVSFLLITCLCAHVLRHFYKRKDKEKIN